MVDSAALRRLERQIGELGGWGVRRGSVVPTGIAGLDALLPDGGLPRGRAIEWQGPRSCGKTAVLRAMLARLRAAGEPIAWIDGGRTLFAPEWTGLVAGPERFWVIRPPDPAEVLWCADLVLRSGAFGAVALDVGDFSARARSAGPEGVHRAAAVRLQRLAEEADALFVILGGVPVAGLRLRFRPARIEPVRGRFGARLPPLRPVWIRVDGRGEGEVPVVFPPSPAWHPRAARDRKGPE